MKKIYSLLLMLLMAVMSVGTAHAISIVFQEEGWAFYDDGTLYISSNSVIKDYASASAVPWHAYRNQVKYIRYSDYTSTGWGVGAYMFCDMTNLKEAMFNAKMAKIGKNAFKNCQKLNDLVGSMADVKIIEEGAFENCTSLQYIYAGTSRNVGKNAFKNCTALERVDAHTSEYFVVGEGAFYGCTALKQINLEKARTIGDNAFYGCDKLAGVNLNGCTEIGKNAFKECYLTTVTIGASIQSIGTNAFYYGFGNSANLYMNSTTAPTLGTDVFWGVTFSQVTLHTPDNATGYNVYPWNQFRSETTDSEIYGALSGTTLTLYYDDQKSSRSGTSWSLSTYYKQDLMNTATKIVIDPSMLAVAPADMSLWFANFKKVTAIEGLQYLNTSETTDMSMLFSNCLALQSIDLSNLNTSNVTYMHSMFNSCSALRTINLNSLDMSNVTRVDGMFYNCTALEKIECDADWTQLNITNSSLLFGNCTSLKGGKGTLYDENYKNLDYARPDGGPDAPGYFWSAGDDGLNHQGIENTNADANANAAKIIRDGQVLIIRGDKTYTVTGQEIR